MVGGQCRPVRLLNQHLATLLLELRLHNYATAEARILGSSARSVRTTSNPPTIRRTGRFLYLRLRRHDYSAAELGAWAARLEPFLTAGDDAFVFFRHDEVGRGPELARALAEAIAERRS